MSATEEDVRQRFKKIRLKAAKLGLTGDDIGKLESIQTLRAPRKSRILRWLLSAVYWSTIVGLVGVILLAVQWPISRERLMDKWYGLYGQDMYKELCVFDMPESVADYVRPPIDCGICKGVSSVDRVEKLTPEDFELKYAYSGLPVVITDGCHNWTATKSFSFKFFKGIYGKDSPVLTGGDNACQFFPYRTNFKSLAEVFNMSEDRVKFKEGTQPWYVGWSNCDSMAANILRTYYDRPYFLPTVAESSKTDWIFMGCPGYGAHMHIDSVGRPSWQAQISGTKLWMLEPPPECYHVCEPRIEVVVNQGEMIVLDTNQWYHSTLILGEDMSITIGSEYD